MTAENAFQSILPDEVGPIVVEVPHAGTFIDAASARFTVVPPDAVQRQAVLSDADIGADLLWAGTEADGIARIVAIASRYVIDLNTEPRLPTPYEEKMPVELRVVRRHSQCGLRWSEDPLPRVELDRRIAEVFEPYHAAIDAALARAHAAYGVALLVASHTFPDAANRIADVVLGTRQGTSAPEALRDAIAEVARDHGFSVALEAPFPGGWSNARHARRAEGVSVVQVEIARRLVSRADGENPYAVDADGVRKVAAMLREATRAARTVLLSTAHASERM